jgi:hypothetical protein
MAIITKNKRKIETTNVPKQDAERLDERIAKRNADIDAVVAAHNESYLKSQPPVEQPSPEPEGGWKFRINGLYKKNMKPNTLFGIMHKVKRTQIGVVSGYITVYGLPDDEVRADGSVTHQWEYVTGGYEVPDATP